MTKKKKKAASKVSTTRAKTSTAKAKPAKASAASPRAAKAKKSVKAKAKKKVEKSAPKTKKVVTKASTSKSTTKVASKKVTKGAKATKKVVVAEKAKTKKKVAKTEVVAKVVKTVPAAAPSFPVEKVKVEKPKRSEPSKVAPPENFVEEEASDLEEEVGEVVLTDAEGRRYCRVRDCDQIAVVENYCRYHYLLLWKQIQVRKKILMDGKLERYIAELTSRYPDKFVDILRRDLRSEKDFLSAIQELEIDDSSIDSEFEDEAQSYIAEVRGMSSENSSSSSDDEEF